MVVAKPFATTCTWHAKGYIQQYSAGEANLIIVISRMGTSARNVAKYRPSLPAMAFTASVKVARQLMLHRGIFPVALECSDSYDEHERVVEAIRTAKEVGWLKEGTRSCWSKPGGSVWSGACSPPSRPACQ